ncbi:hypothetical protein GUJ93_ZPchr0013g34530 [Zizania palustris]|uniref:Uncharacterized protein n=1 Tax=Zizania palustris TaxID=103762 RepID=A0A8J5WVN0_ZIZPA|nr:hypothetical protein GUJ93_ZPchr0013g34530 [Zizania palustris]
MVFIAVARSVQRVPVSGVVHVFIAIARSAQRVLPSGIVHVFIVIARSVQHVPALGIVRATVFIAVACCMIVARVLQRQPATSTRVFKLARQQSARFSFRSAPRLWIRLIVHIMVGSPMYTLLL